MNVIYEPKARAAEYAPLAVNLYTGCLHSCRYCYAPDVARKKRSVFHTQVKPRKNILRLLENDCKKLAAGTINHRQEVCLLLVALVACKLWELLPWADH